MIAAAAADISRGHVTLQRVAGQTRVVTARASSPLRLLLPRPRHGCVPARIVTSTYGGGLVSGDRVALRIEGGRETASLLTTQGSTKIYRGVDGQTTEQHLHVALDDKAICASVPDPITCFAAARYLQEQCFEMTESSSLLAIDCLTSGRWACGERWMFDSCRLQWDVRVAGQSVFADALWLTPAHGALDAPHRMGCFDALATVVLVGPAFDDVAARLLARVAERPVDRNTDLIASASPLRGGAVLRVAGPGAEAVGRSVKEHLRGVNAALGVDPWARK